MPLYDYQCEKCGKVFEVRQKFSDPHLQVHDECGGKVRRMLSAPALQFKGSGWYVTDYGKGGKLPAPTNGKSEKGAETKTGTKTETKSESKAESKPSPAASEK